MTSLWPDEWESAVQGMLSAFSRLLAVVDNNSSAIAHLLTEISKMSDVDMMQQIQYWAHEGLVWIGFGTLVGLVAKGVMPGRDPGGPIATVMMGIVGSVIGGGTLALILPTHRVSPISLLGFIVATVGALVLLAFFRLFVGRWFLPNQPHLTTIASAPVEPVYVSRRRRAVRYEYEQ